MINCYDEWSKLKEVILADVSNDNNDIEKSLNYQYPKTTLFKSQNFHLKTSKKFIDKRIQDLNNLERVLIDNGVRVRRVEKVNEIDKFKTPYFSSWTKPCVNPRDLFFILGNTIIETMTCVRQRYFEFELLNDIFLEHFNNGAKWIKMPQAKLNNENFDNHSGLYNFPMIDGANIYKVGRDILVNVINTNNELAFKWFERMYPEYRWHKVNIGTWHLDGEFTIIRPGLILYNPYSENLNYDTLPKFMQSWTKIPNLDYKPENDNIQQLAKEELYLDTFRLEVNVLMIDENTVIIDNNAKNTIKELEKNKVNVIPISFTGNQIFGGSIHCATLDLIREGKLENYS